MVLLTNVLTLKLCFNVSAFSMNYFVILSNSYITVILNKQVNQLPIRSYEFLIKKSYLTHYKSKQTLLLYKWSIKKKTISLPKHATWIIMEQIEFFIPTKDL